MKSRSHGGFISKRIECHCGHAIDVFSKDALGLAETMEASGWNLDAHDKWECPGCVKKNNECHSLYEHQH